MVNAFIGEFFAWNVVSLIDSSQCSPCSSYNSGAAKHRFNNGGNTMQGNTIQAVMLGLRSEALDDGKIDFVVRRVAVARDDWLHCWPM